MKTFLLAFLLSIALIGCTEKDKSPGKLAAAKPKPDIAAGKAIAQRDCIGCHKLNGSNAAPAIPVLAAQSEKYHAFPFKGVEDLVSFMKDFQKKNG